jgi:pyruvate dehydrogenase E2 component (dihydrolipoamide acetyltransferase)
MAREIVMPRMGLTMESGVLINWLKAEGDPVQAGEPLFEIETDKTTTEVEAPASGRLGKFLLHPGETALVGEVIGHFLEEGESQATQSSPPGISSQPVPETTATPSRSAALPNIVQLDKVKASPAARSLARKLGIDLHALNGSGPGGRLVARNVSASKPPNRGMTPLARRMADEQGLDTSGFAGSGPGGRVTRQDLVRAQQAIANTPAREPAVPAAETLQSASRVQKLMAERMTQSFRDTPHFYLHVEVDARGLVGLYKALSPKVEAHCGVHLTYTDLLVYYCARCLAAHPEMLAQWTAEGIRIPAHVNVGVATDTERGLVVPVILDAERLTLVELAVRRTDLVARARGGSLRVDELEGGGFTITNLGSFGIDSFDAILNPPQAAILAVGRIKERALVENGQLVAASMVTLSLSVDHRVLDGARAARFLSELVELLEIPALGIDWK